eukprot:TRINITY_DN2155_c0_g2_i2.p1 TRINITY_DN2155_c0_g2~~TRINITY_DN2155_c0_g2_i2.p1  ORF type:complete len:160 (+),score=18.38 TRINITY_DN2155_c0_g2_i2:25-480(+)
MIRRPPRSTHCISSAASDVYKRQLPEWTGHAMIARVNPIKRIHRLINNEGDGDVDEEPAGECGGKGHIVGKKHDFGYHHKNRSREGNHVRSDALSCTANYRRDKVGKGDVVGMKEVVDEAGSSRSVFVNGQTVESLFAKYGVYFHCILCLS